MLSIENPPPDPPYQQLKINNDERASQNLPLPEEDLSNAAVLDHSTFPKFSLRDYVFDARSKDIENSWPFSLKHLQLCLKHGVKDLLPPFQSPDFVRNQPLRECRGGSSTSEFQNISAFHGEFSGPKEHEELDTSDTKLDEKQVVSTCIESSSCRCEGENGFSSTMTSISQPLKELVSTSRPSSSSLKTDHLLETPAEAGTSGFPASEKNDSKIKTSGKRCKLIKKSTNYFDQASAADIAMSFTTISESMASKVCPVCKTFSSSSNTTLNAHIDQCLSIASSPKCTSDSKLTRYRIKPRKTKLMVDIYTTARTCTLEELDRRNGTAWATLSGFPSQHVENCQTNGGKKQKVLSVHPEDIDNADAVYIDANGTKLRILSKFSSPSSFPKVQDDLGSRKFRGVKGRKIHSAKKKKCHAFKHHKYFKVASQGRKFSSQQCISQVQEGHNQQKGSSSLEVHKITKQAKPHDSGTLRQWACSKRTRAVKGNRKEGYQPSTFKWHVSRGTMVDTDRSILADSFLERSQVQDQANFSENCVSSPESSERTDNTVYEAHISDRRGWSPVRRSVRSSFSGEMMDSSSPTQMKKITHHPSRDSSVGNCLSKPQNTKGQVIKDYQPSDVSPGSNNKLSRNCHVNAQKATKLNSSRRKEILVSTRSSITGSKSPEFNRSSTCDKPEDHFGSHVEEEIIGWHSALEHSHCLSDKSIGSQSAKEEVTEIVSPKVSRELKSRSEREAMRKPVVFSSSESEPEYDRHHEKENMDSHVRMGAEFQENKIDGLELASKEISFHEDVSVDSSSKLTPKESIMCFCKSMDPQFQKPNNNVKTRCGMLQSSTQNCSCTFYGDGTKGGFSESSFGRGQEMFFADEDCSAMIGHDVQNGRALDSEVRRGNSCFEVDPISIPGPPGSFLPSPPRDMRSEEFLGNSSLSNCWVHSCQDQHDLIDGDSSSSPISATSTVSNSTASRSCLKHNNSSGVSDVFHDKLGSVSPNAGAGELPFVENDVGLSHLTCTGDGRTKCDMFKVSKLSVERGTLGVVNDSQRCRCQRVDRISQGVNVTYQETQLMRHQTSSFETMPAMERKQITYSLNARPNSLDIMPEGSSLSNCRHSISENMGFPVVNSPFKFYPLDGFPDPGLKFSRSNCEPASPATSNPVLRLMGKNLMVVNKDEEDVAMPVKHPQPHPHPQPHLNHVSTQVPRFAGGSPPQNIRNQTSCSFPHWAHQDSLKDQNADNLLGRSLDIRLSKGFRNPANLNIPQTHDREPVALFLKQQTDGGYTASRVYKNDYNLNSCTNEALNWPECRQNEASIYSTHRTIKIPDHQQMNSLSATNAIKEINAMGDGSYCEASLMGNDPKYPGGMRTTLQMITPGVSIPFASSGNPMHVNAFCCYQPKDASSLDKPTTIRNSSFQSSVPSRKDQASPVKWDCTSETPYVRRRGVF